MSAEAIVALLRHDIVSSTAGAVFARNTNSSVTSASQVPPYLYLCLSDMLQGPGKGSTWGPRVNMRFGGTDENQADGIDVLYQAQESVFSNNNLDKSDKTGAEFGALRTVCRATPASLPALPVGITSWVEQADLRIRYLIDCLYRQKWSRSTPPISVGGLGGTIDTTTFDITLDPSEGLYCRWKQYDDTVNNAGDIRSRASLFGINFNRLII